MYTVTFYFNTKLNAINSVDSPATLERIAGGTLTVSDCDITHIRGLDHFTVRASYASLKGADYVKATNGSDTAYFSIIGDITPTSEDVMVVPVALDFWLTGGGINNISFFDGLTIRHHVAKSEDAFGAFCEDDPYMVPSKPLQIADGGLILNYKPTSVNSEQMVEGLLDIGQMGDSTATQAITYTDNNSGETVTVPTTIPLSSAKRTLVQVGVPGESSTLNTVTPGSCYFDGKNATTQAGIAKVRDLGCEGSILNSWIIPSQVVDSTSKDTDGRISQIETAAVSASSGLPYQYASVKNQRVLYGNLNRYVIASVASGNRGDFNPEDIYHSGDSAPTIVMMADPRPQGRPYFRSQYYRGTTDFFINAIPGLEWQTAPLVYYSKSGSEKDSFVFNSEHNYARDVYNANTNLAERLETMRQGNGGLSSLMNGISGISAATTNAQYAKDSGGGSAMVAVEGATAIENLVRSYWSDAMQRNVYGERAQTNYTLYNLAAAKERAQFNLTQSVVEPTLQFPRSESIRDLLGNGVRVYRYRFADSDVVKIDNILEMYGYKDTTLISPTHFTNRSKFNYVQATGLSVRNDNVPMWIREGIAAQLSAGLRIWHVAPDASAYVDGSNV